MEEYKEKFLTTFEKFIKEVYKVYKTKDTEKVLKAFNKFDVMKLSSKYFSNMEKYSEQILEMNDSMFSKSVILLPGIDLSKVWPLLNSEKKKRFFVYVKMLYILSEVLSKENSLLSLQQSSENNTEVATIDQTDSSNNQSSSTFDPYEGVGENTGYDVETMYNNVDKFKQSNGPDIGNIAELVGLDKMLDLDDLTNQLKNMDGDAIDEATKNIQGMMGGNMDDQTMSAITSMLGSISSELKTVDMKSGNIFDNLSNIANVVADKMKPQIDSGEIDIKNLWKSTKSLASKCKEDSGNGSGVNPMEILSNMVDNHMGETVTQPADENTNNEFSTDEYKQILESMGLGHVDVNTLDASTLSMLQQIRNGTN